MWNYPDLNTRMKVRAECARDPEWQAFIAQGGPLLLEMQSTIADADAVLADALTPWPAETQGTRDRRLAAGGPGQGVAPHLGRRRCNPNSCS